MSILTKLIFFLSILKNLPSYKGFKIFTFICCFGEKRYRIIQAKKRNITTPSSTSCDTFITNQEFFCFLTIETFAHDVKNYNVYQFQRFAPEVVFHRDICGVLYLYKININELYILQLTNQGKLN